MNSQQIEPTAQAMMGALKRWWNRANPVLTTGGSAGAYTLTTQGPLSNPPTIVDVTFSATAVPSATPEPGTLFLLGTSLIGFFIGRHFWRRRRPAAALAVDECALA